MKNEPNQPSELGELKNLVREFVNRFKNIENELDLLKEQQKELVEEYSEKLDMKTLKAAMRTVKIEKKVAHKHTYNEFIEVLSELENI